MCKWIIESNRPKHFYAGLCIAALTFLLSLCLVKDMLVIATFTFWVSLVAGLSVEYKDHLYGNKFDWLDVLATILPALSFAVGVIIAGLL